MELVEWPVAALNALNQAAENYLSDQVGNSADFATVYGSWKSFRDENGYTEFRPGEYPAEGCGLTKQ